MRKTPPPRRSSASGLPIAAALGLAALLAYANSFTGDFALDNKLIILKDPRLGAVTAEHLRQIFQQGYWWPNITSELYRPLTTLSYLFNYAVLGNGPRPVGYHVVNFLLHWGNAVLLFAFIRRIGRSVRLGAIAAVLFAVHPVAVESVTNVVGRADLLATFCVLLSAHFYLRAAGGPGRIGWLLALAASSTIGVLCKENGVMILGLVLLYDLVFQWPQLAGNVGEKLRRVWLDFALRRYWAFLPALLVFAYTRYHFTIESTIPWQYFVDNPIARATPFQGFMTAMKVQGEYLALLLWPAHLTCDYSYDHVPLYGEAGAWSDAAAWISLGLVLVLLLLAWRLRRQKREFTFGLLLYAGMMLPTANLLTVIGSIMAERFLYLPAVGFALVAAVGFDRLGRWLEKRFTGRWANAAYAAPVALAAIALGVRTHLRNADWRNELALWTSAVQVAPDSFKTHKNLAESILDADSSERGLDAAIAEAEKSLAILDRPDIDRHIERRDNTLFPELGVYYAQKARACRKRGANAEALRYDEKAAAIYRRAVAVDKWVDQESHRIRLARGIKPEAMHPAGQHDIYRNFALVLIDLGRYDEALENARTCSRLAPFEASPWHIAGGCLRMLNRPAEAVPCEIMAILIKPDYTTAWQDLYQIYAQLDPAQNPIQAGPGGQFRWNLGSPRLRQDLVAACTAYVRLLWEDNYDQDAKAFEQVAISQYGCPITAFDGQPALSGRR
ncbi:MAG TPA: phospholipid carrier-dependent glycosyltransferase [Opitutaceae bacterium]|nr:phospholipid carrier-dependent glycosyltransferase [Opitutaceae bacterium]